jgi:hypothetical protein
MSVQYGEELYFVFSHVFKFELFISVKSNRQGGCSYVGLY